MFLVQGENVPCSCTVPLQRTSLSDALVKYQNIYDFFVDSSTSKN